MISNARSPHKTITQYSYNTIISENITHHVPVFFVYRKVIIILKNTTNFNY